MSAPSTSTYLLQSPDGALTNAQALSSLGTGIIKNTGSAMAIASPTADYLPYHANLASIGAITVNVGDMLVGTTGNVWTTVAVPGELKTWICDGISPPRWGDSGAVDAAYLLTAPGGGEENMPNRRFLQVGSGLQVIDNGPAGFLDINTTGLLNSLSTLSGGGILVRLSGGTAVTRSITSSSSIAVTNGDGAAGNISMSLIPSSVVQNTNYALNGVIQNSSSTLNFVSSPGVEVEITNGGSNITNLYLSSAEAGTDINYVTLTDNTAVLPDSFPLSSMTTGIVKVTHTTGALTTAVAGTDYLAPSANLTSISSAGHVLGELLVANGTGYGTLNIGSSGQVLTVSSGTAAWATPTAAAPTDATYIVKTANSGLSAEFALSTLSTGLVKVTTSTGDLTTASAGTDYLAPSANLTSISSAVNTTGELLVGNGSGYVGLGIGSSGQSLIVSGGTAAWGTPASPDATYILKTSDASIPNAFALSTLSTGLMKVTTTTGAITTASAGTDYLEPSANLTSISSAANTNGELLVGNGSGYAGLGVGSDGQILTVASGTASWATPTAAAPADATYIVQTASSGLSSEFALSTLASGSLQVTTGTGVLSSITPNVFVKCIADGTLPAYTYASGVITFTANGAIGAEYTDNVTTVVSDVIFNNDYAGANAPYLGAYTITTKGDAGTQEVWTRVSTFNSATNMVSGIKFVPTQGLVYANTSLTFATTGAITVGTTPLTFLTDAFTRSWSYSVNTINSDTMAASLFFNLPFGKVFYPTGVFVSTVGVTYTSIPYYFDGSTGTNIGTPFAITGSGSDITVQYTTDTLSSGTGIPTIKSAASGTQAGLGVNVTVAALSSDLPTYTIVGKWARG